MKIERITVNGGFLDYTRRLDGTVEIIDIEVSNEYRRMGRGKALLEALFAKLNGGVRVYAITRASNEVAQQFYEACRFECVGVLRRFYGADGADAIMYGRFAGGPV